jgi:cephalosporin hydroxylase
MDEAAGTLSGDRGAAKVNLYEHKITQSEFEIGGLIEILKCENVTRFLEVGSRYGGSFWRIARALPDGARVVAVDSGEGVGGRGEEAVESLEACAGALKGFGYDAHAVIGDSQAAEVIEQVRRLGPFDAVFIDGDHSLAGVRADWKNYGPLARIVAFHDTHWQHPGKPCKPVAVPEVWNKLKATHRHEEFHDPKVNYGIGVLWRNS